MVVSPIDERYLATCKSDIFVISFSDPVVPGQGVDLASQPKVSTFP